MKRDSLALLLSGTFFGLLVGWIIGTQQAAPPVPAPAPAAAAAPDSSTPAEQAPAKFDASRAASLEQQAKAEPGNAEVKAELANLYFDAERYDQAIQWYEAALKARPNDPNISTDLAIAYYYTNQADRALAQLDRSLAMDPKHLKSLLNRGIILAMGKGDLAGAQQVWERVVALAPNSEEAKRAQQGLDGIRNAHAGQDGVAGSSTAAPH
jgi:tetratricopeptide (TPR) repeat protein